MKKTKMDSTNEVLNGIHSVRFNEIVYTDDNPDEITIRRRSRRKSGILKRRENTLRTADAPPIILSDEGLKAGRVSPFINLTLFLTMTLRSIGIVFGDIGTSPLYVVKTIFDQEPTEKEVIGAISLIVWSLIVVVSLKYAIFILIADNRGEGGPFALCSLLIGQTSRLGFRSKQFVSIISMLAACLLIGDGALTPAVSILSACEGLVVAKQSLDSWTVRISVILIIILFLLQRWGPSKIGILFGPIMVCWFIVLLIIGIWRVTDKPIILKSFNPWQALKYLIKTKKKGFFQIGSIFLSVTGLETLYADLGHFGRWPVRFSWFTLVFPSVLFNYLGQGALLILYPQHIDNPFYHSVPNWALWPIIIFSIISSTIASQAVITGSFTLVSQAVAMGFCVPFDVIHTSRSIISHIYVPAANYFLLFLTLTVTIGFQSSGRITDAYGVTVCSVMVITTILYMLVMRFTWSKPIWLILCFSIFLIIDLYTFAAICTTKIDSGGWVAIIIAFSLFVFSFSWYYGNLRLNRFLTEHYQTNLIENLPRRFQFQGFQHLTNDEMEEEIDDDDDDDELHRDEKKKRKVSQPESTRISLVETNLNSVVQDRFDEIRQNETIKKTVRIPGVGCYLTTSKRYTPYVFENFVKRMNAHQEILIFLKVEYARTPSIDDEQRLIVRAFDKHIYHITSTFGYDETNINLLNILQLAHQQYDIPIDTNQSNITFILPYQSIHVITYGWRTIIRRFPLYIYALLKGLFPGMPLNFKLIPDNTVQLGILADV